MLKNLGGRIEIKEGIDAVAHGVLDGVATFNVRAVLVAAQRIAQPLQHLHQRGLVGAQDVVCLRRCRIHHRSAGEGDGHGIDGAVGVRRGSAGHARGIVGDHAADGAGN